MTKTTKKSQAWKSAPASIKQTTLVAKLLTEKDLTGYEDFVGSCNVKLAGGMNGGDASAAIDWMLGRPNKPGQKAEPGYYVRDEDGSQKVYVVVENKAKTGTYAKGLQIVVKGDKKKGIWVYAPGVGRALAAEGFEPLTIELAVKLSHMHGVCVICGKALTDPKSVAQGIGPVCKKKIAA